MASKAHLTYFNGRGLAESIRIILSAAGIEFTETYLKDKPHIDKLRADGVLLFSQVPRLEIDGKNLVQSLAITRYIARKHGMDGKTDDEKVRVDILNEGARDFLTKYFPIGFMPDDGVFGKIKNQALPRYLPVFEKVLSENSNGYLVGDGLTYADLTLFEALLNTDEFCPGSLEDFPKLKAFKDKIASLPRIKAYLEGPQRKGRNTPEFVAHALETLSPWTY